ncbi:aminopeptidase [Flagelloscypha sp. PMI_526]|nr:aminopeptidase [Flagelloscypha sp. PMI_526]
MKFASFLQAALVPSLLAMAAPPVTQSELRTKASQGMRLLSLSEDADLQWVTEDELLTLLQNQVNFFDVTDVYKEGEPLFAEPQAAITYDPPSHQEQVQPVLDVLVLDNLQKNLKTLSNFTNRYYKSANGEKATQYIISTVQGFIDNAAIPTNATVTRFGHSFTMGSVIAKFPGTSDSQQVTIIGAHLDSINGASPSTGVAPGMDDDGTGTVNLLEAIRGLIETGFSPASPVEFHWYAGEEGGLLGSQDISTKYKSASVPVRAMLQLDMTGYTKPGFNETIAIIPDFTDASLNTFVGQLVDKYLTTPKETSPPCGYGCSDHASWNKQGYPSSFPFETNFGRYNPKIHGSGDLDTVPGFSYTHSFEYVKLAVAFAVELSS